MVRYDFDNPIYHAAEDCEEDSELPEELARLLQQESTIIQPHQELVEIINIGEKYDKKEIKIGVSLENDVKKKLIEFMHEYVDVFIWSNQDMPGLDTNIVVHKLPLKEGSPQVKQKLTITQPDMAIKIIEEVHKQLDAGFLAVENYPQWVANILLVPNEDGKVQMCIDYRDLNKESPEDDFPLPHINVLVDNTTQFFVFSFIDGFFDYNHIKMALEDMEKLHSLPLGELSVTRLCLSV